MRFRSTSVLAPVGARLAPRAPHRRRENAIMLGCVRATSSSAAPSSGSVPPTIAAWHRHCALPPASARPRSRRPLERRLGSAPPGVQLAIAAGWQEQRPRRRSSAPTTTSPPRNEVSAVPAWSRRSRRVIAGSARRPAPASSDTTITSPRAAGPQRRGQGPAARRGTRPPGLPPSVTRTGSSETRPRSSSTTTPPALAACDRAPGLPLCSTQRRRPRPRGGSAKPWQPP